MADIPPEARACAPFHGIRIVSPHRWEGEPFAVASCPHGTREAHGRAAVQRLSAAYAAHREVCARQVAPEAPQPHPAPVADEPTDPTPLPGADLASFRAGVAARAAKHDARRRAA